MSENENESPQQDEHRVFFDPDEAREKVKDAAETVSEKFDDLKDNPKVKAASENAATFAENVRTHPIVESANEKMHRYASWAPAVISAVGTVAVVFTVVKIKRILENELEGRENGRLNQKDAIGYALDNNLEFRHFPGIGVLTFNNKALDQN